MIKKYPFKNILTLALLILFTNEARAQQKTNADSIRSGNDEGAKGPYCNH